MDGRYEMDDFKYPSFRIWLFGGSFPIANGACLANPLWKRFYYRYIWKIKNRFDLWKLHRDPNYQHNAETESCSEREAAVHGWNLGP